MPVVDADRVRSAELKDAIERRIVARTGGQIQSLQVDVTGDQIVLAGYASCNYHKQLALQGVFDTIGATRGPRIQLNIEVVSRRAKRHAD